jgi:hypothetical protein
MKHLHELPIDTISSIIFETPWLVSQKLDGSFIQAGLDKDGKFYTKGKGKKLYYSVEEWPMKYWANHFRIAHMFIESMFFDTGLINQLQANDFITFEILNGSLQNSIKYPKHYHDVLYITNIELNKDVRNFIFPSVGTVSISTNQVAIKNNKFIIEQKDYQFKMVRNTSYYQLPDRLMQNNFKNWLDTIVEFHDFTFTNQSVLKVHLNKRPEQIPEVIWKEKKTQFIKELKQLRSDKQMELELECRKVLKHIPSNLKNFVEGPEGFVITAGDQTFKLVDRSYFIPLNNFTHRVKYALVGGRRPEKPCFLSRTAHWSDEQKLNRIRVLKKRFIKYAKLLTYVDFNTPVYLTYSHPQLYKRTLAIFIELEERFSNGRSSI